MLSHKIQNQVCYKENSSVVRFYVSPIVRTCKGNGKKRGAVQPGNLGSLSSAVAVVKNEEIIFGLFI